MGIYNCATTLQEALDSLYAQTYQDFEIILCDDGSKDNTYDVALDNQRQHANIVLLRNEQNLGLNATLNKCLAVAKGEYIARMDGDDISLPTRFEKQVKFLDEHPEYAVVSAPMIYFDENGEFRRGKGKGEVVARDFVHGSPICHAPCMARTEVFRSVGGYSVDERLLRVEDYHLWFKIFAAGYKLFMMDECLYMMRDDREAFRRRTFKSRVNETYVKSIGYRMINLPFYYQVFALRPLLIAMLPDCIYRILHKK
jgi:glycosyltransferase EpsE